MKSARRILTVVLICLTGIVSQAQPAQYKFIRLDIGHGLSNNHITAFLQDSKGFMWFGTISGLNRYDGNNVTVFRNDIYDKFSLPDNNISRLFEGPHGKIWIATSKGMVVYDPEKEIFISNTSTVARELSLPDSSVTEIIKDLKGNYWFAHLNSGVFLYDSTTGKTTSFMHKPGDTSTPSSNHIASIAADKDHNIWIIHTSGVLEKMNRHTGSIVYRNTYLSEKYKGEQLDYSMMADADGDLWFYIRLNNRGVFHYDASRKRFTHFQEGEGNPRLNTDIIRGIVQDSDGLIWIGTDHGGINLLDKRTLTMRYLLHDADDETSLSQNTVNSLYKDRNGIIWVGTYKDGINYYHEEIFRFSMYQHKRDDPRSLPYNDINRFVEDNHGNLWLAANGGGLIYFDRKKNTFKQFLHDPKDPSSVGSNVIVCLYIDREDKLWIGTYYGGLSCYDGKKFVTYKHDPNDPSTISDDSIWEIYEDSRGNLWIGTLDGGLDVLDRQRKKIKHYDTGTPIAMHSNYVSEIKEDNEGNFWIGIADGLEVLNPATGRFTYYLSALSNDLVTALWEDSRGLMWIGTQEGLNVFDRRTKTFKAYTKSDGLPHNTILSLVEDRAGNLWMSTPNGISHGEISFDADSLILRFKNYDETDGLQGKEFTENAALKTSSGELIFGGAKGFNIFYPETIGINKRLPSVVLSDFYVFNKRVKVGEEVNGNVLLSKSIMSVKEITLQHADNFFAIGFSALSFFHPEKNKYRYKLEGFNKDWITTDASSRTVTYTNLDPGTYTFRVNASNNDGLWNDQDTTLKIVILPPFWKSQTAMVLYAVAIVLILLLARRLTLQRERMRYAIQRERIEAQRMHELDMMKIKFFTNVSHEFRTPLTLILTPIEKLLKNAPDAGTQKQYQLIHRNARRLLNLVNQLLDFRKVEVQGIRFNPSEGDIIQFIRDVTYSFSDLSEKKEIQIAFHSDILKLETFFDQDKLEKILFNLLSNAFKFTPEHGRVEVRVGMLENGQWLEIKVIDTGIGIAEEDRERIFERFFQRELPANLLNQGSGIGLSITKEFVRIHGGSIHVASKPEAGSCFTVLLPIQQLNEEKTHYVNGEETTTPELVLLNGHENSEEPVNRKNPVVLLIEDNEDFRFYLKDNLKEFYTIVEAKNGREGWDQAIASMPDLIVSDVMMPEMNGIELCRRLKNDERTSHIPVVLLTARTSEEQRLEGYETGASDYVAKPFNFEILQSRIKNIIRQQELNRKAFQQQIAVQGSNIQVTSLDEKLIRKAIALVEENIGDPEFSVETLSKEIGMSRIHLYRKLHSLTGKSPIEFIRTIRLQRAAQLLEKSQLTVSEIAYQVGFNNPKYFTRYFKEEFNVLPSAYASRKTK